MTAILKRFSFPYILLAFAFFLSSCAPDYDDSSTYYKFYPDDFVSIEKTLKEATVDCASRSKCFENVGLIFSTETPKSRSPELHQCTGFLVAPGVVGTNSHCVPDAVKTGGWSNDCSKHVSIRFKDFKKRDRVYNCERMINFSKYKEEHQDFAFFKIAPTDIKVFPISKTGFEDSEILNAIVMNPMTTVHGATMEVKPCEVALGTIVDMVPAHPYAVIGSGLRCKVIGGNSGSPMVNKKGEVVAIAQAYMKEELLDILEDDPKYKGASLPYSLDSHVIFTNLSCVKDPVTNRVSPQCKAAEELEQGDCMGSKAQEIQQAYVEFKRQLPGDFRYRIEFNKDLEGFVAVPYCVQPMVFYSIDKKYIANAAWERRFTVSKGMRRQNQGSLSTVSRLTFEVSLREIGDRWVGSMSEASGAKRLDLSLKSCGASGSPVGETNTLIYKIGSSTEVSSVEFYQAIEDDEARLCSI